MFVGGGGVNSMCDLRLTWLMGVIKGQYVLLPSRVQYLGTFLVLFCTLGGEYIICAQVSRFLMFGNFLKPTNVLSLKVFTQSLLCSIMFQLEWMKLTLLNSDEMAHSDYRNTQLCTIL